MEDSLMHHAGVSPTTSTWRDWQDAQLVAAKGQQRISVGIPARDEAATIGAIVAAIKDSLIDEVPLVDEFVGRPRL
jgi:glucosyl-3-phosphoglycerate synthase